ncbi:hypothetical protein AMTRI_Chr07g79030 [Amborella trichopoda]
MKIFLWNIIGLGEARKKRALRRLLSSSGVSDVWRFWGLGAMALCFAPSPGASGGLLIVWDPLVLAGTILFASFRILYARSS